ncbi:MAG: hypothetical protein M1828_004612 [Chrysothrix sp. TS-e1954]|nr:MAG: hypothetical protein M1828_004612 [Chrysothrix sp. TS-e1954]
MEAIKAIPGSLWNYISPQRYNRKPTQTPSRTPLQSPLRSSPTARQIRRKSSSRDSPLPVTPVGKRSRSRSSSGSSLSPKRRHISDAEIDDELHLKTAESSGWDNALDEYDESLTVVTPQDYSPPTATALEREYARREKESAALAAAGWASADVALFRKLAMRGFEPLMPWEWSEKDLSALPTALFTKKDDEAFIKGLNMDGYDTCFRAIKHFSMLLELGEMVRTKQLSGRDPGRWIKHEIKAYVKWTLKDAGLADKVGWPPILAIQANAKSGGHELQLRMIKQLRKLSREWTRTIGRLPANEKIDTPSVYGIIVSQTVLAFVAYIAQGDTGSRKGTNPTAALHTIGLFDFSDRGYDVWNALALAIFAIHCRNQLVELTETAPSIIRGKRRASLDTDL